MSERLSQKVVGRETRHQTTDKETALPPIRGPVDSEAATTIWNTFSEAPSPCRETVAEGNLARLNDYPPLGPWPERPIS